MAQQACCTCMCRSTQPVNCKHKLPSTGITSESENSNRLPLSISLLPDSSRHHVTHMSCIDILPALSTVCGLSLLGCNRKLTQHTYQEQSLSSRHLRFRQPNMRSRHLAHSKLLNCTATLSNWHQKTRSPRTTRGLWVSLTT